MNRKNNILVIHLEFSKWKSAKSWSYQTQLGLFDGFKSEKYKIHHLLNPFGGERYRRRFGSHVMAYVKNKKFDQVWMEIVHTNYDQDFLSFIFELAPVRVAMLGESIYYTEEEIRFAPVLRNRSSKIQNLTKYFTHALCIDEADSESLKSPNLEAIWWVPAMPKTQQTIDAINRSSAIFSGPSYGNRASFLNDEELKLHVEHLVALENDTQYPLLFDITQLVFKSSLFFPAAINSKLGDIYAGTIHNTRSILFDYWIEGLKRGVAVVQLPHFVKAFPGRIYEGMAAGRPVITPMLKDRPRAMQLFTPNEEILYYGNKPSEIVALVEKLNSDRKYAEEVASNALAKVQRLHNTQRRTEQILRWIENNIEPNYYD